MIRSNIRRRKSQKSQINGAPSYGGGSFGGGTTPLPDLTTLQYVPYNVDDAINWLIPDRKVKSDLGFVGNLEGNATTATNAEHANHADTATNADNAYLLNNRSDYYHTGNSNSFKYSWTADGFFGNDARVRNVVGKEGIAGSTKLGDLFVQYFSDFNTLINVDGSGKCGVGTNNPSDKMHVIGNVRASGDFIGRGALLSGDLNCNNINASGNIKAEDGQFNNLKVLGNLDVYELTANQTRVTNGDLWIQNSCKVSAISVASDGSLIIETDEPMLQNNDLCIIQVRRSSGSVIRFSFKVVSNELGPTKLFCSTITGSHTNIIAGDLIVQVGNTTNTARQSSVLNCVSFGGYGAATLYYANVDAIPVGSFYPDTSKITSAMGDLRSIGFGSASVFSKDGEFSGNINSTTGKIANFWLENDRLRAKNIQLIDGNMPTLTELAGDSIIDNTITEDVQDNSTTLFNRKDKTFVINKSMTLRAGINNATGSCSSLNLFSQVSSGRSIVALKSYQIQIIKINARTRVQEVIYTKKISDKELGSTGQSAKSYRLDKFDINLDAGEYIIRAESVSSVTIIGTAEIPLFRSTLFLNEYELRPVSAITYIASNGITSFFGYSNYMRHESGDNGIFEVRKGEYMLRISETTGIQKSINGGGSWQNI